MSTELQKHIELLRRTFKRRGEFLANVSEENAQKVESVCAAAERCEAAKKQSLELSVKLTEAEALVAALRDALHGVLERLPSKEFICDHDEVAQATFRSVLKVVDAVLAKTPADMGRELTELRKDKARLDFAENELGAIASKSRQLADTGDYYEWWEAIEFHMQKPNERVIGTGNTIRQAIDAARKEVAK